MSATFNRALPAWNIVLEIIFHQPQHDISKAQRETGTFRNDGFHGYHLLTD